MSAIDKYKEIQASLDNLGYISREINTDEATVNIIPPIGKTEYEIFKYFYPTRDRVTRYLEYEDMNANSAEISSALDIYADDASKRNERGNILEVRAANEAIKAEVEKLLFENLNINITAWNIIRSMCMYGDHFAEIVLYENNRGVAYLKQLPQYTVWRLEENGHLKAFAQDAPTGRIWFQPWQIVHWRLASTTSKHLPYGTSILESIRRTWRQLRMQEDAMVVYRLVRAPERRVFKIPVGNLPPDDAIKYVRKIMSSFRKTRTLDFDNTLSYKVNAMPPDEDFFIPVRNGEGVEIETLSGAESLGEIDDVLYFRNKIFAALKVPRIFLQDTEGIDERKQNVSQQDIMFARTIERVQNHFIEGLKKIIYIHLILRGYKLNNLGNIQIIMTPPSYLEELMRYEIWDQRASIIGTLTDLGFPKARLVQDIFNLAPDEWERLKKERYEERREEEMVDSGEYWEQGQEGNEDSDFVFEALNRRITRSLNFNDLHNFGEIGGLADGYKVRVSELEPLLEDAMRRDKHAR